MRVEAKAVRCTSKGTGLGQMMPQPGFSPPQPGLAPAAGQGNRQRERSPRRSRCPPVNSQQSRLKAWRDVLLPLDVETFDIVAVWIVNAVTNRIYAGAERELC